jgi:hypothetical protein
MECSPTTRCRADYSIKARGWYGCREIPIFYGSSGWDRRCRIRFIAALSWGSERTALYTQFVICIKYIIVTIASVDGDGAMQVTTPPFYNLARRLAVVSAVLAVEEQV